MACNLTSSYTHLPSALHEPLIKPSEQTSPISGQPEPTLHEAGVHHPLYSVPVLS